MKYTHYHILLPLFFSVFSQFIHAQHSPWLLSPGDNFFSISLVNQKADEAFLGDRTKNLPNNGTLEQDTYWLNYQRGLFENVNIELSQGYSIAKFGGLRNQQDFTDTTVGLSYQILDEFLQGLWLPSISVHLFSTTAGGYQTQRVNAIGDGADGLEYSVSAGKIFSKFGIYGDLGIRDRQDSLPDERFWNVGVFYSLTPQWTISSGFQYTNAYKTDRSDAAAALLEEDTERYSTSIQYRWARHSVNLGFSEVIDGRSAPKSDIFSLSFSSSL